MPQSGCPVTTQFSWSEGRLRQDTEDTGPLSNWSNPFHLKGEKKDNEITQHFCVKADKAGTTPWPAGKYCIYKKEKCPNGKDKKRLHCQIKNHIFSDHVSCSILHISMYGTSVQTK